MTRWIETVAFNGPFVATDDKDGGREGLSTAVGWRAYDKAIVRPMNCAAISRRVKFDRSISFRRRPQFLYVENILLPPTCQFVPDEIIFRNHVDLYLSIDEALDSVLPGFVESDAIDALQDVHAGRWLADLESGAVREISGT